jgi:hypothetical protein
MLVRNGYGVLLFDRRGEGEGEGDPNALGWAGERDLDAAVGRRDADRGHRGLRKTTSRRRTSGGSCHGSLPARSSSSTPGRAAAGRPKAIWRIPEVSHTGGITTRPEEYEQRVVGFFDRALLGPAGRG